MSRRSGVYPLILRTCRPDWRLTMKRSYHIAAILALGFALFGCSGASHNPSAPEVDRPTTKAVALADRHQTHLWGHWDVFIDIPTQTIRAVPNRQTMFTANVVNFINANPLKLGFHINGTPVGYNYVDVDIDVTITHPFPGLPQYNGYDVRGIFMGDGSASLAYNPDLIYPMPGPDQIMLPDPVDGFGGPDGYTRWFNRPEFSTGGMPLFQYTQGKAATPGFNGNATLNAYKYFADGLGATENLQSWIETHPSQHGVFSAGSSDTRNYYLRFPDAKGIRFGYAIIANWEGAEPQYHPSNAPEAVGCKVLDSSNVYYVSPTTKGGKLKLDVSIWDWDAQIAGGVMEDYKIYLESTVLNSVHQFTTGEMTPIGGGEHYSTYHVEIPADNVPGVHGNEYWVIVEEQDAGYQNEFGVTNLAGSDPLAAFFRFDLTVADNVDNTPPVITGITDDIPADGLNTTVTDADIAVTYIALFDDPDPDQTHSFKWYIENLSASGPTDPPDSMPYNWAPKTPANYKIWVKVSDGFVEVTGGPYVITRTAPGYAWTRTWGGASWDDMGYDIDVDASGNVYVVGRFAGTADFDPGTGVDNHTTVNGWDVFLSKYNASGTFQWAKTWGGTAVDYSFGYGVAVDGSGDVYVTSVFTGTVDFDPGAGTNWHTSNGDWDVFLSKFDPLGTFIWANTWGGTARDDAWGVAVDGSGNVYTTGDFKLDVDFDPSYSEDIHSSNSSGDAFLSAFSSSGAFLWADSWGGAGADVGTGVTVDQSDDIYAVGKGDSFLSKFDSSGVLIWAKSWGGAPSPTSECVAVDESGNIYISGTFAGTVDFDPGPGVDNHPSNGTDAFISKFDSSGNFLWARTWGGLSTDSGDDIAVGGAGEVCVIGWFAAAADFDPGPGVDNHTSNGGYDAFLTKFDSSGTFLSAKTWGGIDWDFGYGVAADGSGNVYATGIFQFTVDFDPGPGVDNHTSNGGFDVFVTKFAPE